MIAAVRPPDVCGLVGIAFPPGDQCPVDTDRRSNALASIRHRGPDDLGEVKRAGAWLGHTRLSILDLSSAGHQPMVTNDERFALTYNGEIYNFRELVAEYGLKDLRSSCDTEVLLRLFAQNGPACLSALNGMFAFAVHDTAERKLWLVRDRFGIKPLYYRCSDDGVRFASEIKALLALDPGRPECSMAALHEWLYYGNSLGERTLFADIQQVLPGHSVEIDLERMTLASSAYWCIEDQARRGRAAGLQGVEADAPRILQHLEKAVERQLVSDVPVGVFLSGGVDSTAIVALASRHLGSELTTYTAGFDFAGSNDELPVAREMARYFGTNHHELFVTAADIPSIVAELVAHHDQPFADAANIPLYLMARELEGRAKVVLQGDGGDELFGGYRRYSVLTYRNLFRSLAPIAKAGAKLMPESPNVFRVRRYANAMLAPDIATSMALLLTTEGAMTAPLAVLGADFRARIQQVDPFERFRDCESRFGEFELRDRMSFVDLSIVLPDTFLEKVDRATMAASLEVRVPFLDNALADVCIGLPGARKMPFGKKKGLLKQALADIVPDQVLMGRKRGLTVPFKAWLMGPLRDVFFDAIAELDRARPELLDTERVTELFERTKAGRQNHAHMLWKLFNFAHWVQRYDVDFKS